MIESREVDLVLFQEFLDRRERRPAVTHVELIGDRVGNLDHRRARRRGELGRNVDSEIVKDARDIARPADGDRGGADHVFQDQVPADQPGDELTHRGIRVSISRTGDRDGGGHLGVAEAGEGAGDAARERMTA